MYKRYETACVIIFDFPLHFFVLQQFWKNRYPSPGFSIQFSIGTRFNDRNDLSKDIPIRNETIGISSIHGNFANSIFATLIERNNSCLTMGGLLMPRKSSNMTRMKNAFNDDQFQTSMIPFRWIVCISFSRLSNHFIPFSSHLPRFTCKLSHF